MAHRPVAFPTAAPASTCPLPFPFNHTIKRVVVAAAAAGSTGERRTWWPCLPHDVNEAITGAPSPSCISCRKYPPRSARSTLRLAPAKLHLPCLVAAIRAAPSNRASTTEHSPQGAHVSGLSLPPPLLHQTVHNYSHRSVSAAVPSLHPQPSTYLKPSLLPSQIPATRLLPHPRSYTCPSLHMCHTPGH